LCAREFVSEYLTTMGAACCKAGGTDAAAGGSGGTLEIMFNRIDKEKKGYISMKNLEDLMRDDKTYFQGKDTSHIMNKFGADNRMTFEQFKGWWGSTYTTYGEDNAGNLNLSKLVDEVNQEKKEQLETIVEISENLADTKSHKLPQNKNSGGALDTLAVNRS